MVWLLYFVIYFDKLKNEGIWYFILKYILMYIYPTLVTSSVELYC